MLKALPPSLLAELRWKTFNAEQPVENGSLTLFSYVKYE